ncbi:hypothetical protein I4U23_005806 [Adineta vaga]|nr:hypothetical protein I4U23_005806 [Adineta vaga]
MSTSSFNFVTFNQGLNRYGPIPLIFFGLIGNILNILVFTRQTFRNNSCIIFFLASSISDGIKIIAGLVARVLNGFNYDASQYSSILCKFRLFTTYYSGYTAAWFIGFACIERYLTSSTDIHKRQLVTKKNTYLSIIFVLIFGIFVFGEEFYCIDSYQHLLGAPQSCYQLQQNVICQIVDSLMQFLFEIFAPALMMMIFGYLIVRNIRRKHLRVITKRNGTNSITSHRVTHDENKESIQKRDVQLIMMLLIQVIYYVFSSFPISIYKFYAIATMNENKSSLRRAIENTIFILSILSLFSNNCVNFYIYTLSGTVFRKELWKIFRRHQ